MKILVFTEGTVLMHALAKGVSREERVRQSKAAIIQRILPFKASPGSVNDLENYIPVGNAVENDWQNLYFRKQGENYKNVAEKLLPDVLIEDDCESIGGEKEMVYPHIKEELKSKIKSVVIKEFEGIDNLP
ncbi:MAG: hypothetical protein UR68_C0013G0019 [Candidatus Roizmanbacteria bacterium GW2011_GWA2_35_19]|uniref:Uncharacterized protein n=1 Tax=Candidatus Roizmanbacteria bacterium GW2011_GWA2_35_19 TaxID=1618478 RepID=A0A0G0C9A1_9BACT|nr:MAG: hypothetical protein UR68_C0013G0019 [Candidatus Roizmanbacteria bacterium GW2011_GWA2_35_19]